MVSKYNPKNSYLWTVDVVLEMFDNTGLAEGVQAFCHCGRIYQITLQQDTAVAILLVQFLAVM